MTKYNKYLIIIIVILVVALIGVSYSAFTTRITGAEEGTTLSSGSGTVEINFDGGPAINVPDIYPREEEFLTKEFTLNGTNSYNTKMDYHLLLVMNTNTFRDGALAYTLTSVNDDSNGETAHDIEYLNGIKTGEREIFLGNGHFTGIGNNTHTYTLKMYLPEIENFNHTVDQSKSFSGRIEIREGHINPGYNEEKGINHPVLFTGMTPVVWDGEEFIPTTSDDPDWYDYDNQKWANARTQDGSYWVWIPRYAYKITTGYRSSTTGTIDVQFLRSTTNLTKDKNLVETTGYLPGNKDTSMHYFLHPAFQFNGDELGFWMAKYEATAHEVLLSGTTSDSCNSLDNVSTKSPLIVPNATSWRCINISNAFKASLGMKDKPIYGWNSNEVDTHMLTNNEWGAVAYLSKSQYGAPSEVWNNSYNGFQTGCSGPSVSAHSQTTCTEYHTENGQYASTTHNIYGVYDMSGGAWERVMGNYNNMIGSSGFGAEELSRIHPKYITKYYTAPEDLNNGYGVNYDVTVFGDGVHETSTNPYRYNGSSWDGVGAGSWYSDHSY
ncbi:MAG TPA: hypothetical protein VFC79_08415, partial [Tissierellaceae bacterium]|nr:hypothetical protein [Tissierellaceae bacterium]